MRSMRAKAKVAQRSRCPLRCFHTAARFQCCQPPLCWRNFFSAKESLGLPGFAGRQISAFAKASLAYRDKDQTASSKASMPRQGETASRHPDLSAQRRFSSPRPSPFATRNRQRQGGWRVTQSGHPSLPSSFGGHAGNILPSGFEWVLRKRLRFWRVFHDVPDDPVVYSRFLDVGGEIFRTSAQLC